MYIYIPFDPLSLVLEDLLVNHLGEAPVFPRKFGLVQYDQFTQMVYVGIHGVHYLWHIYWHHKDWAETRCSHEKVASIMVYECKECSVMILKTCFFPLQLDAKYSTATDPVCPKDYAPKIAENGLDPTCGHLAKGSWLGGASVYSRFITIITLENLRMPWKGTILKGEYIFKPSVFGRYVSFQGRIENQNWIFRILGIPLRIQ